MYRAARGVLRSHLATSMPAVYANLSGPALTLLFRSKLPPAKPGVSPEETTCETLNSYLQNILQFGLCEASTGPDDNATFRAKESP